jgi:hypothetical protein
MAKLKAKVKTKKDIELSAEPELTKLDPHTASLVTGAPKLKAESPVHISNVYIGGMNTLSWSQNCHSGNSCYDEVWIDTETTLFLYKDKDCKESAGLVAIYNGGRVRDNSSLLATATAAYLAKAPINLIYVNSSEPYARGHGRLRAVIRLSFRCCTPCGCE